MYPQRTSDEIPPTHTHTRASHITRVHKRVGDGQGVGWVGGMIHAMANFLTPVNKRRGQNICLVRLNGANGCCKSVCPSVCQCVCVCDIYLLVNIFIVRGPLCIPDYFISPRSANSIYFWCVKCLFPGLPWNRCVFVYVCVKRALTRHLGLQLIPMCV